MKFNEDLIQKFRYGIIVLDNSYNQASEEIMNKILNYAVPSLKKFSYNFPCKYYYIFNGDLIGTGAGPSTNILRYTPDKFFLSEDIQEVKQDVPLEPTAWEFSGDNKKQWKYAILVKTIEYNNRPLYLVNVDGKMKVFPCRRRRKPDVIEKWVNVFPDGRRTTKCYDTLEDAQEAAIERCRQVKLTGKLEY